MFEYIVCICKIIHKSAYTCLSPSTDELVKGERGSKSPLNPQVLSTQLCQELGAKWDRLLSKDH